MAMYIIISTVLPEAKALGTKLNLGSAFLHYGGYMNLKKPMSIEEQIEKIRKHKIVISDEEAVKRILEEISYYRLTGYALQYRAGEDSSEYVEEISFDSICRIYQFDSELRSLLRKYIEKAEVYYRCQIAKAQTEDKEVLLANRRESEYSISRYSLDTSHRCSLPIKFLQ